MGVGVLQCSAAPAVCGALYPQARSVAVGARVSTLEDSKVGEDHAVRVAAVWSGTVEIVVVGAVGEATVREVPGVEVFVTNATISQVGHDVPTMVSYYGREMAPSQLAPLTTPAPGGATAGGRSAFTCAVTNAAPSPSPEASVEAVGAGVGGGSNGSFATSQSSWSSKAVSVSVKGYCSVVHAFTDMWVPLSEASEAAATVASWYGGVTEAAFDSLVFPSARTDLNSFDFTHVATTIDAYVDIETLVRPPFRTFTPALGMYVGVPMGTPGGLVARHANTFGVYSASAHRWWHGAAHSGSLRANQGSACAA